MRSSGPDEHAFVSSPVDDSNNRYDALKSDSIPSKNRLARHLNLAGVRAIRKAPVIPSSSMDFTQGISRCMLG